MEQFSRTSTDVLTRFSSKVMTMKQNGSMQLHQDLPWPQPTANAMCVSWVPTAC